MHVKCFITAICLQLFVDSHLSLIPQLWFLVFRSEQIYCTTALWVEESAKPHCATRLQRLKEKNKYLGLLQSAGG